MLKENHSVNRLKKTLVHVILTHVDRMNTVFLITRPSWRQAVRLKPTGAHCRCCKPSASTPRAKKIGCLLASALEGKENIYGGKHSNWIFDYKPTLPQGVSPLGSVWVDNLLSVLSVQRFNYLCNIAEFRAKYLDVSIAQPLVYIYCKKERNPQRLSLTTPVLTT